MRCRVLLLAFSLAAAAFGAREAHAGENVRADGRFRIWSPDTWVVEAGKPNFVAHNADGTVQAVAARLPGAAGAVMERAKAFIEEELDEVDFDGNTLSGTAEDEGDDVDFAAVTVVDGADVLIVLTYGDRQRLGIPVIKGAVERIRASLKSQ